VHHVIRKGDTSHTKGRLYYAKFQNFRKIKYKNMDGPKNVINHNIWQTHVLNRGH
jgi:hypothetical protein